jgi:hypothetical protein
VPPAAGPGSDELTSGPERDPRRTPRWLRALVVLTVLSVVAFVAGRAVDSPAPAPGPSPTAVAGPTTSSPTPSGPRASSDAALFAGPLSVGAICPHTDGSTELQVQFQIENIGSTRLAVLAVRPVLPIGGLRPRAVTFPRSPSCGTPAARTGPSTVLDPGDRVGVQLAFRLPAECPAPYPVQADIDLRQGGRRTTERVPLLPDLGSIHFDTCPDG